MTTLITPLPTPPTRQDSANFNDRADEFLGALPLFQQEANGLAIDVQSIADEIEISRQAVVSVTNITKWVSGNTYSEGVSVWSPINGVAYRKITSSSGGTTDPSLDDVNYKSITDASGFIYMPAGTGAVATTVQAELRTRISITNFGAAPSKSSAENTTCIQAAINSAALLGKSVFVPAGTYYYDELTFPQQHGGIEIIGEAGNSMYNMENGIYRGSVLISTKTTGNSISCDGGIYYSNRCIRVRNLSIRVSTSGYAIYLKRSPELNLLENLTVYNDNPAGGSGIALESCWTGTRLVGVQVRAAAIGTDNIGINVFNDIKAGGISLESTNATMFAKNIRIGPEVYQAALRNSGGEGGKHGLFIDGNDPKVLLDTCHFEFNKDIAVFVEKSAGFTCTGTTFYRNAEQAAGGVKAEIYFASGGLNYNYNIDINGCDFFGLGSGIAAIYVSNSAFASGSIRNNRLTPFGTNTTGLYIGGTNQENFTIEDNNFDAATTPYSPSSGYKRLSKALNGTNQIRFAPSIVASDDPNTLDDYEEGSWTPTLGGVGGQSGQAYGTRSGYYQKIGSRVYFTFSVTLTTKGSIGLEAALSGLPFTIAGDAGYGTGFITDFENLGVSVSMISIVSDPNNTRYLFRRTTSASAGMGYEFGSNLFTNTTTIRGGGWYVTTA